MHVACTKTVDQSRNRLARTKPSSARRSSEDEREFRSQLAQFDLLRVGQGAPSGAVLVRKYRGHAVPVIFSSISRDRASPSAGGSAAGGVRSGRGGAESTPGRTRRGSPPR